MRSRFVRVAVALGAVGFAAAGVLLVGAAPASAHVTVNPSDATQGERARIDFRVPNESDSANTVALEVAFPQDPPLASASVGKVAGWSVEITYRELAEPITGGHGEEITEVVDRITWTAEDPAAEIAPGEFGEFPVGLGPLPEAEQLIFPALQTYSDGEVVRWIDEPVAGSEPESPAPVLTLAAASDAPASNGNGTGGEESAGSGDSGQESAADDSGSGSGAGTWLGLAGLVAGLAGLALGGIAFTRTRGAAAAD